VSNSSPNLKIGVYTDKAMKDMVQNKTSIATGSKSGSFDDEACFGSNLAETLRLGNFCTGSTPDEKSLESDPGVLQNSAQETIISEEWGDDLPPLPAGFKFKHIVQLEVEGSSAQLHPGPWMGPSQRQSIRSKQSSTWTEQLTLFSDWNDVFDDYGSFDFTKSGSLVLEKDSSWSLTDQLTARDSRMSVVFTPKRIHISSGKVMGMFMKKKEYHFQILNLNSSLDKVVDLYQFKESGRKLHLSFSETGVSRPKVMSRSKMKKTLADSLGPQFDAKKQGVVFATGPVNSKLCVKMSVCELSKIEQIFSLMHAKNSREN